LNYRFRCNRVSRLARVRTYIHASKFKDIHTHLPNPVHGITVADLVGLVG
jgi:hypothetical protein